MLALAYNMKVCTHQEHLVNFRDSKYQISNRPLISEDTNVYSSDEDEKEREDTQEAPLSAPSTDTDVNSRIEQALDMPDLNVNTGPGFPDLPPLKIDLEPSPASEEERHNKFNLSSADENFIRNSMSEMKIVAPPWASSVNEGNWKDELRKHLDKD